MKNKVSLLLIGDAARRAAIRHNLREYDIALAGEIFEPDALRLVPRLSPDVVVLDFAASEINSFVALQWLKSLPGCPKVIAVGAAGSKTEERFALELGAEAYAKLDAPGSIVGAWRAVTAPLGSGGSGGSGVPASSWTSFAA